MLTPPGYGLLATPIVSVRPSCTGDLGCNPTVPCHVWNRTVASASSLPPVLSLRWIFCKSLPWLILSTLTHAVTKFWMWEDQRCPSWVYCLLVEGGVSVGCFWPEPLGFRSQGFGICSLGNSWIIQRNGSSCSWCCSNICHLFLGIQHGQEATA